MSTRTLAFGVCDSIERTTASTGKWSRPQPDSFRAAICTAIVLAIIAVPVALAVAGIYN